MSGERQGRRETMDRFVRQLVENGNDPNRAKSIARREAVKADTREDRKRER